MQTNDEVLWAIAKKRASFKKQLITYCLVCGFFWGLWFMSGHASDSYGSYPWPVWISFWWGIGLAFSFANAYVFNSKNAIQQEYEKIKNQQ